MNTGARQAGSPNPPDKLGAVLAAAALLAVWLMPFVTVKANRIAAGKPLGLAGLAGQPLVVLLFLLLLATALCVLFVRRAAIRLAVASVCFAALVVTIGVVSTALAPQSNAGRVTPGGAFWILFAVICLIISDALAKIRPRPWLRIAALGAYAGIVALCLWAGLLDNLSLMKEFAARGDQFWREAATHLQLSFGALAFSLVLGLPLAVACFRRPLLRAAVLRILGLVQTIPSLALFGLLMLPLGYLAAHVPGVAELGIRGIGVAPALVALVLYSLLPIVANTVVGLNGIDPAVRDAALGMGLSQRQILMQIELPLAFPVILTGIRIVLVQTIGLVTVAALIGGGGFGSFIFQGLGQTAMDLVLLGAIPTVFLAFASALVLDAVIDILKGERRGDDRIR